MSVSEMLTHLATGPHWAMQLHFLDKKSAVSGEDFGRYMGEAKQLADKSDSPAVKSGIQALAWFVLAGWAIYPIGYMCMPGGWLSGVFAPKDLNLFYNIADAINKIGFGLVVYNIAVTETKRAANA